VIKHLRSQGPIALVFQHGRYADLLIGAGKRIYYANRCVAYDISEEQILALWETVGNDIENAEIENRIKIEKTFFLNWIDSGASPEWNRDTGKQYYSMEEETVSLDGKEHNVSFLRALRILSGVKGVSPHSERIFYYTQKWTPYLNIVFFFMVLFLTGSYFRYSQKSESVRNDLIALEDEKAFIQKETDREVPLVDYKEIYSFVKDLAYYRDIPSCREVINDISGARSSDMLVEVLKMDYNKNRLAVEIFGRMQSSFEKAYKDYQAFEKTMKGKGYSIEEERFNTEISSSMFLVKLSRRIR